MKNLRVLLVDDSSIDREACARMLRKSPLGPVEILEAGTGEEGLALLRRERPDCVLLDYLLPDMDGLHLLEEIGGEGAEPDLPIVMLTDHGDERIACQSIKSGAQDYLMKSQLHPNSLYFAIESARAKVELRRTLADQGRKLRVFAQSAAHDLKAPLRKVESYVQILLDDHGQELSKEALELVGAIRRSSRQMRGLVQGILGFARCPTAHEWVDLEHVVRRALSTLKGSPGLEAASVEWKDLPKVWGDEPALLQVFQNLIGNGVKFNRSARPSVAIEARIDGSDRWLIEVRDNGIGMTPEGMSKLFEPFTQLNGQAEFEGSGLGLATCRSNLESLGGSISVASEPGKGTTFTISLQAPRSRMPAESAKAPAPAGV